jgi:hypothetical protein
MDNVQKVNNFMSLFGRSGEQIWIRNILQMTVIEIVFEFIVLIQNYL